MTAEVVYTSGKCLYTANIQIVKAHPKRKHETIFAVIFIIVSGLQKYRVSYNGNYILARAPIITYCLMA